MNNPKQSSTLDLFGNIFCPSSLCDYVLRAVAGDETASFIGLAEGVQRELCFSSNVYCLNKVFEPCIEYQGQSVEGTRLEIMADCVVDIRSSAYAPDFFHKTVWEMVDNARRFALLRNPDDRLGEQGYRPGKIYVGISLMDDKVCCEILDSGPGISAKTITKLMRKRNAMRAYKDAKDSTETSCLVRQFRPENMGGLGLTTAMNYTQAIGGLFLVQNVRGNDQYRGTKVYMQWPVEIFNDFDQNFMNVLRKMQGVD